MSFVSSSDPALKFSGKHGNTGLTLELIFRDVTGVRTFADSDCDYFIYAMEFFTYPGSVRLHYS